MDSYMEDVYSKLCEKLRCSVLAADIERMKYAREMLFQLQHRDAFKTIFRKGRLRATDDLSGSFKSEQQQPVPPNGAAAILDGDSSSEERTSSDESKVDYSDSLFDQGAGEEAVMDEQISFKLSTDTSAATSLCKCPCEKYIFDTYQDYFKGFDIIDERGNYTKCALKQCVELLKTDCDEKLETYLRDGIRCFLVDLFTGTDLENQSVIVRLRESELCVSKEYGFPITTTIIAKLSPRHQHCGILEPPVNFICLRRGDLLGMTTDRHFSMRSTQRCLYVNARFLFVDLKPCDHLLIGPNIQVRVQQKVENHINCVVVQGGILTSFLPVLFPPKCQRFRISVEELEDITFAKEVGINVIVSNIIGTKDYFDDLMNSLNLLECDKMRICARFALDELQTNEKMHWAANGYDGFLVEMSSDKQHPSCLEIVRFSPAADFLLQSAYYQKKPILLYPGGIAQKRLIVDPRFEKHIFYYPDKYIFQCDSGQWSDYFHMLKSSLCKRIPKNDLTKLLACDQSINGSDSLARSCVAASYECNARAILVFSLKPNMPIKIAHYRPKAPIIFITAIKSFGDFISMYQNVIMLSFTSCVDDSHKQTVYKQILFGLMYAKSRQFIRHDDNVIIVYCLEPDTNFSDQFLTYKYHEKYFAEHLSETLFP